jgi:hypothetical protein
MADGYNVTSQGQTQELGQTGNLIDVIQVTAVSVPEEYEVVVRVPLKTGWPDVARRQIEARLAEMRSLLT